MSIIYSEFQMSRFDVFLVEIKSFSYYMETFDLLINKKMLVFTDQV